MNLNNLDVLIVEDEKNLGSTLHEYLSNKGAISKLATTAKEAKDIFFKEDYKPDVILMDIGLPDGDGIELAKSFKEKRKDFILLFLSAQNEPEIRFEGLSIGAEDYITKPFDLRELILRLERILNNKNNNQNFPEEISIGNLKIWFKRYEVQDKDKKIIPLTFKECSILKLLYKNLNNVVSRDEIIDKIWGEDQFPSNRTVDNYIVKLRKWSDTDQASLSISSIRGVGYKLETKLKKEIT